MRHPKLLQATVVLMLFLVSHHLSMAQDYNVSWSHLVGGSEFDGAYNMIQLHDGNFLAVGNTISNNDDFAGTNGEFDATLIKFDADGNIIWKKTYGGSASEGFWSVIEKAGGNLIAVGYTFSNDGDVSGNHGGADLWMVLLNSDGDLLTQRCFGGTADDFAAGITMTAKYYYLFGVTNSNDGNVSGNHGDFDAWVLKLRKSNGKIVWSKCYGGSGYDDAYVGLRAGTAPLISGFTYSTDGDFTSQHGDGATADLYAIKLDQSGNIIWSRCYGGSGDETSFRGALMADGNLVLSAGTTSNDGDISGLIGYENSWIPKINVHNGNIIWSVLQGTTDDASVSTGVIPTADNGAVSLSVTVPPPYDYSLYTPQVIKIDAGGNITHIDTVGGSNGEFLYDGVEQENGDLVICGVSSSNDGDVSGNHGSDDQWLLKLTPQPERLQATVSNVSLSLQCFPNPADNHATIQLTLDEPASMNILVTDVLGKIVYTEIKTNAVGSYSKTFNVCNWSKGIYFIRCKAGSKIYTGKLMVE